MIALTHVTWAMFASRLTPGCSSRDREFSGFGLPSDRYCDCYLDEEELPLENIKVCAARFVASSALLLPGELSHQKAEECLNMLV